MNPLTSNFFTNWIFTPEISYLQFGGCYLNIPLLYSGMMWHGCSTTLALESQSTAEEVGGIYSCGGPYLLEAPRIAWCRTVSCTVLEPSVLPSCPDVLQMTPEVFSTGPGFCKVPHCRMHLVTLPVHPGHRGIVCLGWVVSFLFSVGEKRAVGGVGC